MTDAAGRPGPAEPATERAIALVWVDSREAYVVRSIDGAQQLEHLTSDVPARRRATGHVRHDPAVRHGGGGPPQNAGEPHRLEHLARFLDAVAGRTPEDDDLIVLGPGTVRTRLLRHLQERDERRRSDRSIQSEPSGRLTPRQLEARLRRAVQDRTEPRR